MPEDTFERRIEELEQIIAKFWLDVPGGPPVVTSLTESEVETVRKLADREMEIWLVREDVRCNNSTHAKRGLRCL